MLKRGVFNIKNPIAKLFEIENKKLYDIQDEVFKGNKILVGIELNTSFIFVEGSSYLFDELTAFAGLDEYDIRNYFVVAQYESVKAMYLVSDIDNKQVLKEIVIETCRDLPSKK